MGIITATVPVLLTKAPVNPVTSMMSINKSDCLPWANRRMRLLMIFAKPVLKIPAPTTNNPNIIMTTGLENPSSASLAEMMSHSTKAIKEHNAMMSVRIFPWIKSTIVKNRIIKVVFIGVKSSAVIKKEDIMPSVRAVNTDCKDNITYYLNRETLCEKKGVKGLF